MSSIRKRAARRRRRVAAAVGAAVAVVAGLQLSTTAFGTDDKEPADARPATTPSPTASSRAERQDFGFSDVDGTRFRDGVMTFRAPDAPPSSATSPTSPTPPTAQPSRLAAPAPHGEGWRSGGAAKLLNTGYTIKFHDQKTVDRLAPYVRRSAADLRRITNLPVTVDTRPVGWDYVRPKGEVVIGLLHRPCVPPTDGSGDDWQVVRDGSGGKSLSCGFYASSVAGTVTGGHAYIDDEFFTADGEPAPSMGETDLRNHISHELGHTMGLAHAQRGPARGDCVKGTDSGQFPVMCTPSRAYRDKRAGTYVQQYDVQGLRHLARAGGAVLPPQGKVTGIGRKCLAVEGGKAANGTGIQLNACDGGVAQSWILQKDGTFRAFGKCLDSHRAAAADGDRVSLRDCDGGASQRWAVTAGGQIAHVASGKVLDLADGSTADGTQVRLHTPNASKGQRWVTPK
ncbi:ricin-type beta-trefoil lectin domain protein [Streptomyces sp. NPDC023327]|uniref:ricin-type beta-trefoil lectin domain protein n=1 Tax=Streptomyces sp. NPDC023327 TaxID=3157088 RepID=UPI0033FD5277